MPSSIKKRKFSPARAVDNAFLVKLDFAAVAEHLYRWSWMGDALHEEGGRRVVTVLFSDLSGYTALNQHLDPEAVEAVMFRLKQTASQIIRPHGGIVNQFIGDEIVALFGVNAAHEDDPVRAVRAALDLHATAH